jgi:hypothetical protein
MCHMQLKLWHFLVTYDMFSCIRQVTKDSFSSSENPLVWNPILLKCILCSFRAQFSNTSCKRLQRFWHRQHGQVNDSFISGPRNIERKCGAFILSMFCIFLVATLHTIFSRKSHCLHVGPWPWPTMGNLLDVGRTSTLNTNTLRWKVWTSCAPSTWFHQHYGGIFAYNGQGTFEIVVQF